MSRRDANYVDAHVGARLRFRRQMVGMSQEKLGDLLGITFQQVQKYEKGSNRVSASRLHMMSKVLGVPVQFFFDELVDEENPGGFSESSAEPTVMSSLASPEGVQLLKAFNDAGTLTKKRLIVAVARTIADNPEPA